MKWHPLMQKPNITFVTVEDISEMYCHMNDVVYNPALPYDERLLLLQKKILQNYRRNIPYELAVEIAHELYDMDSVVTKLRKCLFHAE